MSINWMTGHLARWAQAALLVLVLVPSLPAQAENGLAPNFTLRDINGANVTLSSLKGEVVMISFWATWCAPCKQEMPHLDAIRQDFGVKVLSISTDDARASSKVKAYIRSRGYGFTVLLDKDSTVVSEYNPSKSLPYTVLIDRSGKIHKVFQGFKPGEEEHLKKEVKALVDSGK